VVGTVHSPAGLRGAKPEWIDVAEIRVDCLPEPPGLTGLEELCVPGIVTVRDPLEGGSLPLGAGERQDLYLELLPGAAAIDIEARNLQAFRRVVNAAAGYSVPVIASCHDFSGVPKAAAALKIVQKARDQGAMCVKIAATVSTPAELGALIALAGVLPRPFSLMGMGALGRVSRLALAGCGSCLNYGWLGSPQVPGQWPARELRSLILRAMACSSAQSS